MATHNVYPAFAPMACVTSLEAAVPQGNNAESRNIPCFGGTSAELCPAGGFAFCLLVPRPTYLVPFKIIAPPKGGACQQNDAPVDLTHPKSHPELQMPILLLS